MDRPAVGWRARIFGGLADRLAAEGERRLLWLPVFLGAGIGIYFVLRVEPPLWPGIVAAVAGAGATWALRIYPAWREATLAVTELAAGFALMRETAWERNMPMLQRHLGPIAVTGPVVDIDLIEKGWRIIIEADPLPGSVLPTNRDVCAWISRRAATSSTLATASASRRCQGQLGLIFLKPKLKAETETMKLPFKGGGSHRAELGHRQ